MISNELETCNIPWFTHNCDIKDELDTLILDKKIQKNVVGPWLCKKVKIKEEKGSSEICGRHSD
jgi:hypothetical protein